MPTAGRASIEKDQQQELRRAAHEPDVDPGDGVERPDAREAHQGDRQAENDAEQHGQRGDLERQERSFQEESREGVAAGLPQASAAPA